MASPPASPVTPSASADALRKWNDLDPMTPQELTGQDPVLAAATQTEPLSICIKRASDGSVGLRFLRPYNATSGPFAVTMCVSIWHAGLSVCLSSEVESVSQLQTRDLILATCAASTLEALPRRAEG